jgi:hypothetical protein
MTGVKRTFAISVLLVAVLTGCGSPDTLPVGGRFVTPPPGGMPTVSGPTPASAAVTRLVPFADPKTGISGLAPSSWQLFSGSNAFQISTAPTAPDGFIGMVVPPDHPEMLSGTFRMPRAPSTIKDATNLLMNYLKTNQVDGPPPQVSDESGARRYRLRAPLERVVLDGGRSAGVNWPRGRWVRPHWER